MALTAEQETKVLARFNMLVPEAEDEEALVRSIIADAAAFCESYCNRTQTLDGMLSAVGDLAIIAYNRRGTEGESARTEGGATLTFEVAPARVYDVLKMYRLARAGGTVHENARQSSDDSDDVDFVIGGVGQ